MCASLSVSNILKCVEKKCLSILSVWNEIGVEGSELDEKMDSVINQIEVLLERILADQRAKKMQLSQSIEELITSISEISLELNNTPFDPPKTATLLELYNFLLTKKDKLLKDAKDYIQKFSLLKDLEKKLCSRLCEAEITLVYKVIPSQEQMTLLSRRVEHLNLLKAERITKFLELRSQMIAGYEKLGKPLRLVSDSCCLVKDILAPEALETFTLSEENMFSMADIVDQLASDCARLDTECNVYRDRLNLLVNLLNPLGITCDIIEYENSNLTLLKLRTEVDRLEGLRTRHLDTLISTAQSQVYQCWDDCFVGEEHRQKFKFFIQNKDSKDVLSILEKEIITWKDFKKSNSEFIIDIIKWCEQFSSLQSLKKRMKEPSVLQNRGGILLKLEKERKQYSRDLPCLEGRVKEAFFNLCSTSPSLSSVIRLGSENLNPVDFIQKSWENLQNDKENEKPIVCIPKSANSSASSVIAERQAKQSRVVGNFPKKPELIKSKIDSRRRSRSVPPGGQKVIFPKVVMQQDKPTTSKNVLDDMNLYAKSSLTKQSVSEVDSFFEGLKGSSKVPHVSTFIQ
ncbi:Protein regulator of cytokinesis 1 [Schistosoma japonicum]|nr:Protein regulator of cytokinesis 1 [Schistosoma japonicum]